MVHYLEYKLLVHGALGDSLLTILQNKDIRTTSQAFHSLGFFWARQCGMYDSAQFSLDELPSSDDSEATKDYQWRIWVAKEIQLRALLGHYIIDGLMGHMFGRAASIRHTANKLRLPSTDALFEANSADEWISVLNLERSSAERNAATSFRSVFHSLFQSASYPTITRHPDSALFTAFSLRVILEGIQTLVSDISDDDLPTVGIPTSFEIRRVLIQVHSMISSSQQLFAAEKLELLLRWHGICLELCIRPSELCKSVCSRYGIVQHIWGGEQTAPKELDLIRWASTSDARRVVLHAIAIQEMVEQLPRGRAHVTHIPSSLFAAATVYIVLCLAGLTQLNLPSEVDWKEVLSRDGDCNNEPSFSPSLTALETTRRFIADGCRSSEANGSTTSRDNATCRNLLYELNSMQKLFRCLSSQWGISFEMEEVMDQWIALCHR